MTGVVTLTKADALTLQTNLDNRLGYPRNGIDVGGGFHQPISACRSLTSSAPIQNPNTLAWAVPTSPEITAVIGASVSLPPGATIQTLDTTWIAAPSLSIAAAIQSGKVA